MALSLVGQTSGFTAANATAGTLTLANALQAGDTLVSFCYINKTVDDISGVTSSTGAATFVKDTVCSGLEGGGAASYVDVRVADNVSAGAAPTITFTKSASCTIVFVVQQWRGCATTSTDQHVGTPLASTTAAQSGTTGTLSQAAEAVIGFSGDDAGTGQTYTVGAGYSNLISLVKSAGGMAVQSKIVAATTAVSSLITLGTATDCRAGVLTLKQAAAVATEDLSWFGRVPLVPQSPVAAVNISQWGNHLTPVMPPVSDLSWYTTPKSALISQMFGAIKSGWSSEMVSGITADSLNWLLRTTTIMNPQSFGAIKSNWSPEMVSSPIVDTLNWLLRPVTVSIPQPFNANKSDWSPSMISAAIVDSLGWLVRSSLALIPQPFNVNKSNWSPEMVGTVIVDSLNWFVQTVFKPEIKAPVVNPVTWLPVLTGFAGIVDTLNWFTRTAMAVFNPFAFFAGNSVNWQAPFNDSGPPPSTPGVYDWIIPHRRSRR